MFRSTRVKKRSLGHRKTRTESPTATSSVEPTEPSTNAAGRRPRLRLCLRHGVQHNDSLVLEALHQLPKACGLVKGTLWGSPRESDQGWRLRLARSPIVCYVCGSSLTYSEIAPTQAGVQHEANMIVRCPWHLLGSDQVPRDGHARRASARAHTPTRSKARGARLTLYQCLS